MAFIEEEVWDSFLQRKKQDTADTTPTPDSAWQQAAQSFSPTSMDGPASETPDWQQQLAEQMARRGPTPSTSSLSPSGLAGGTVTSAVPPVSPTPEPFGWQDQLAEQMARRGLIRDKQAFDEQQTRMAQDALSTWQNTLSQRRAAAEKQLMREGPFVAPKPASPLEAAAGTMTSVAVPYSRILTAPLAEAVTQQRTIPKPLPQGLTSPNIIGPSDLQSKLQMPLLPSQQRNIGEVVRQASPTGDPLDAWATLGERWQQRYETDPFGSMVTEAMVDPLNVIGTPVSAGLANVGKAVARGAVPAARAIKQAAPAIRQAASAVGEAIPDVRQALTAGEAGAVELPRLGEAADTRRFYHVADPSYRRGDDLLSFDELEAAGSPASWKWEQQNIGLDTDSVSLFKTPEEARQFQQEFQPKGKILSVDLPSDVRVGVNSEGYPIVGRRIPSEFISEAAPDTRRFYHGTGAAFETPNIAKGDKEALKGPGYYLTSNADVAGGYAGSRGNLNQIMLTEDQIKILEGRKQAIEEHVQAGRLPRGTANSDLMFIDKRLADANALLEKLQPPGQGPNLRAVDIPRDLPLFDTTAANIEDAVLDSIDAALPEHQRVSFQISIKNIAQNNKGRITGDDVYDTLADVTNSKANANATLERAGYAGLEYAGGRHMPLLDERGRAIEHSAVVVFPAGLPKIKNAISGTIGGSPPEVGGAVVGAVAYQDDPNLSPAENLARRAAFAGGGAALGNLGRRLGGSSRLGGTIEDASRYMDDLTKRMDEIDIRLGAIRDEGEGLRLRRSVARESSGVQRPPWAGSVTNEQLIEVAQAHDMNPYRTGWYDALDPEALKELGPGRRSDRSLTGPELTRRMSALRAEGTMLAKERDALAKSFETRYQQEFDRPPQGADVSARAPAASEQSSGAVGELPRPIEQVLDEIPPRSTDASVSGTSIIPPAVKPDVETLALRAQDIAVPKPTGRQAGMFAPGEVGTKPEFRRGARAGEPIGTGDILGSPQFADDAARVQHERAQQIAAGQGEMLPSGAPQPSRWRPQEPVETMAPEQAAVLPPPLTPVAPKVRFEAGKKLTPEERKQVLGTVVDAYRAKNAPKVVKGIGRDGEEIIGYEYNPDYFEQSGITGRGVRYYIKLPDGTIAHPSELYPELTDNAITKALEQEQEAVKRQTFDAKDLQRRRDARVADTSLGDQQKGQANQRYIKTGRPMAYSYFAKDENGAIVRVDGMSKRDVDYYASKGFTSISEPVKSRPEDAERVRRVASANAADLPSEVLADFPDLEAKIKPPPAAVTVPEAVTAPDRPPTDSVAPPVATAPVDAGIVPPSKPPVPPRKPPTATATPPPPQEPRKPRPGFAGNIRLSKYPEELRPELQAVYDADPAKYEAARRGVRSDKQVRQDAIALIDSVGGKGEKSVRKWQPGQAWNAEEVLALREVLAGKTTAVMDAQKAVREVGDSTENLVRLRLALEEQRAAQQAVAGVSAEAGRALRQFRQSVQGALASGDETQLKRILDRMGGRQTTEQIASALAKIDLDDKEAVYKFVRSSLNPQLQDYITELFYNSILSGVRTHEVNLIGNTLAAMLAPIETLTAAAVEVPLAAIQGRARGRFFGEVAPQVFGMTRAIPEGVRKAAYVLKNGYSWDDVAKLELRRGQAFQGTPGAVINLPSRALAASDAFMRAVHYSGALNSGAYRFASREGLKGRALAERIADLRANPSKELLDYAGKMERYLVYQQEPGSFVQGMLKVRDTDVAGVRPLRFVLPFIQTPANLVKYGLERSPLGVLNPDLMRNIAQKSPEAADNIARWVVGSSIAAAVAYYVANGKITGPAPQSQTERDRFYREGKQAYSIKVGDRWVPYNRFEPLNQTLTQTAIAVQAMREGKDAREIVGGAIAGIGKNLVSQTYMSGIADIMDAIEDPERYGANLVERAVTGIVVPFSAATRTAAQTVDPTIRKPEGFLEEVQAGIPGLSQNLPPRLTAFGEEARRESPAYLPVNVSQEKTGAVDKELARLDINVGFVGDSIRGVVLSRDEQQQYQRLSGQLLKKVLDKVVASPIYQRLDDKTRAGVLQSANRRAKAAAGTRFLAQLGKETIKSRLKAVR